MTVVTVLKFLLKDFFFELLFDDDKESFFFFFVRRVLNWVEYISSFICLSNVFWVPSSVLDTEQVRNGSWHFGAVTEMENNGACAEGEAKLPVTLPSHYNAVSSRGYPVVIQLFAIALLPCARPSVLTPVCGVTRPWLLGSFWYWNRG